MLVRVYDDLNVSVCELFGFSGNSNVAGLLELKGHEPSVSLPSIVFEPDKSTQGRGNIVGSAQRSLMIVAGRSLKRGRLGDWGFRMPRTAHFISSDASFQTIPKGRQRPKVTAKQFMINGGKDSDSFLWTRSSTPAQNLASLDRVLDEDKFSESELFRHLAFHQLLGSKRGARHVNDAVYKTSEFLLGIEETKLLQNETGYLRRAFCLKKCKELLGNRIELVEDTSVNSRPLFGFLVDGKRLEVQVLLTGLFEPVVKIKTFGKERKTFYPLKKLVGMTKARRREKLGRLVNWVDLMQIKEVDSKVKYPSGVFAGNLPPALRRDMLMAVLGVYFAKDD